MDQHQPPENNQERNKILHETIKRDFIEQSKSLSFVERTIAGVILGTIWAICYKEKNVEIPNIYFLISLIFSILFFLVELAHYYFDAYFYHKKSDQIVKCQGNVDNEIIHDEVQKHSKHSFLFLNIKTGVIFILSLAFIISLVTLHFSNNYDNCQNNCTIQKVEEPKNK